jgi:hypothetical protein
LSRAQAPPYRKEATVKTIEDALKHVLSPGYADGLECSAALYQYAAGEGTLPSDRAFRAHLETCAHCRADLDSFAQPQPAPRRARSFGIPLWLRGFAVAAACVSVLLLVKLRSSGPPADSSEAVLRAKGAAALHVSVVRDGKTMPWAAADHLLPGDELRFSYSTPQSSYAMLFAADETGTVERLFPAGAPTLVKPGDGAMGAAEVDARPGCQWLIASFLDPGRMPNPEVVVAAVRTAVAQRPAGSCELPAIAVDGADVQVKAKRILAR